MSKPGGHNRRWLLIEAVLEYAEIARRLAAARENADMPNDERPAAR